MRNSRRAIAALVCALALLALPAQAAAPEGKTAATTIGDLGSWLVTVWDGLLELLTGGNPPPPPNVDLGGSCIDPNGCGQTQ